MGRGERERERESVTREQIHWSTRQQDAGHTQKPPHDTTVPSLPESGADDNADNAESRRHDGGGRGVEGLRSGVVTQAPTRVHPCRRCGQRAADK